VRGVIRPPGQVSLRSAARTVNHDTRHIKRCVWPHCGEPLDIARVGPLCVYHALLAHEAILQSEDVAVTDALDVQMQRRKAERERQQALARERGRQPGWIYYLRTDGRLKIGYSGNVRRRMRQYPPDSVLLAVHPGTPDLETEMHRRFAGSRAAGREWFRETADLAEHITQVVAEYGDPASHRYHYRRNHAPLRVRPT
jgi:T5orf172 domain